MSWWEIKFRRWGGRRKEEGKEEKIPFLSWSEKSQSQKTHGPRPLSLDLRSSNSSNFAFWTHRLTSFSNLECHYYIKTQYTNAHFLIEKILSSPSALLLVFTFPVSPPRSFYPSCNSNETKVAQIRLNIHAVFGEYGESVDFFVRLVRRGKSIACRRFFDLDFLDASPWWSFFKFFLDQLSNGTSINLHKRMEYQRRFRVAVGDLSTFIDLQVSRAGELFVYQYFYDLFRNSKPICKSSFWIHLVLTRWASHRGRSK